MVRRPKTAAEGDAVEIRKRNIEHDEIGYVLANAPERIGAGGCGFDLVALATEKAGNIFKQETIVVYD